MPEDRERILRGAIFPSWTFICAVCGTRETLGGDMAEHPISKFRQTNAVRWAREYGWTKPAAGWTCPNCSTKGKPRAAI